MMIPKQLTLVLSTLAVLAEGHRQPDGATFVLPRDVSSSNDGTARLIKVSELEPAFWASDAERDLLGANHVHFVDITDITDEEVLRLLSTAPADSAAAEVQRRLVPEYPGEIQQKGRVGCLLPRVNNDGPIVWLRTMTDMWNRHYRSVNGTIASQWMFDKATELAGSNPLMTVERFEHSAFNQPSVIVRFAGKTDDLVIAGAHFDSIAGGPAARAPGADDNASGVVVVLEALRVLAASKFKPHNTIEFHFYGGEEGGLLGAFDIFNHYKATDKSVLGFVNQDMAGYSPSGMISIFTDYVDPVFTEYVRMIAEAYTGPTTRDVCGYGCSDHAPAFYNGFPAAYVCDEVIRTSSPFIHSSRDTYNTIMFDAILRHSKFTVAFLVEAGLIGADA